MEPPKRKNTRLSGFDYSQTGGYFITVCTHEKKRTLSKIRVDTENNRATTELTPLGTVVQQVMKELAVGYGFFLDCYVIMPNHIHMLLMKESAENSKTVGQWVGALKSMTMTRWCKIYDAGAMTAGKVWQRNYFDHILRNEADYIEKRKYIEENLDKWHLDEYR